MGMFSPPAERLHGDGQREDVEWPPVAQQVAPRKTLHEVGFPLVLLGLRGLPRAALAREGHVPALVLGVLQGCVIVFQDDLGEDAVLASSFSLGEKKAERLSFLGRAETSSSTSTSFHWLALYVSQRRIRATVKEKHSTCCFIKTKPPCQSASLSCSCICSIPSSPL